MKRKTYVATYKLYDDVVVLQATDIDKANKRALEIQKELIKRLKVKIRLIKIKELKNM